MREYLPLLIVGAIIGVFSIGFIIAFVTMKDKKEAIGFDRNIPDREIVRRLLVYVRPYKKEFGVIFFIMLLSIGYDLISPVIIGGIEEMIKTEFELPELYRRVAFYAALLLLSMGCTYIQSVMLQRTGQKILSSMRKELFTHIEGLSHAQLNNIPVGKLVTRECNDTNAISFMFTNILVTMAKNALVIIGVLVANGAKVSTDAASTFNRFQPHSKTFDVARLFFRTDGSATIGAAIGKQPVRTRTFGPSGSVQMYEVKGHGSQLTYTFNGLSGTFTGFGMAMESNRGVILDCLSMRGSNGLTLKDIPQHTLNDFHRLRPYDLIIVQFGLNVAVAGNPQKIIKLYATHMRQVITHLRQSFPDASILVMSTPDHDGRSENGITTLKEVKWLVAYQQQLAADCHVGWLNFFKAMGGNGATKRLVDQNMANKDYTHLSYGGGQVVAKRVYPSFKAGLNNYLRRKKLEQE